MKDRRNQSLAEALKEAEALGCKVRINGPGEWSVWHPSWPRPTGIDRKRKSTTRVLATRLRQLEAHMIEQANAESERLARGLSASTARAAAAGSSAAATAASSCV